MARPRVEAARRRRNVVGVRLTDDEYAAVRAAALSAGETPGAWMRGTALAGIEKPRPEAPAHGPPAAQAAVLCELRRIGGNLNQAVRLAHSGRWSNIRGTLESLREAVLTVLRAAP